MSNKKFQVRRPAPFFSLKDKRAPDEIAASSLSDVPSATIENSGLAPGSESDTPLLEEGTLHLDSALLISADEFPHPPDGDGRTIKATIANVNYLLKKYGVRISYDVIKKKILTLIPGHQGCIENTDSVALTRIIDLAAQNGMSTGLIPPIVEALADRNPYNPVANWILEKPWDGTSRLNTFYDTLTEKEGFPKRLKETLLYRWLLSAVAAALSPQGFYCRGILTLQGPQSIGKTSWIRALIPDPILREQVLKLDHHLDASSKDSLISAVTHWIVEIGELDSSLKKDVARLKGFITSDRDKIRRPYGRVDSEYQRRTVFSASVNDQAFLVDTTGNTRFWTIPVTEIDYQHDIDMQQLFAEIAIDYQKGERWWLDRDEENCLEACNNEHRTVSVIRERLLAAIDPDHDPAWKLNAYSASEALQKVGIERPSNPHCKEAASLLRELYGDPKKIQGIYRWRIPFIKDRPLKFEKFGPIPNGEDLF